MSHRAAAPAPAGSTNCRGTAARSTPSPTTVDPGLCKRTAAWAEVGHHTDPATDVSLFHVVADDHERAAAVDLMEGVLARLATEELLAGLPVPPRSGRGPKR